METEKYFEELEKEIKRSYEIRDLKIKKKSSSSSNNNPPLEDINLYYECLIYEQSQADSENVLQEEQMLLEQQDYIIILNPKTTIEDEGFFESMVNWVKNFFGNS